MSLRGILQAFTYIAITLAIGAFFLGLSILAGSDPSRNAWAIVSVSSGIFAGGLYFEWKRDPRACATYFAVLSLFITLFWAGIRIALTGQIQIWPTLVLGILGLSITAFLIWHVAGIRKEHPEFPDVLVKKFNKKEIFETGGVHIVGGYSDDGDSPTGSLVLFLQNVYDAPQKVSVALSSGRILGKSTASFPGMLDVVVGAGEVGKLNIPIGPGPQTESVYITIETRRTGGRVVRYRRMKVLERRIMPWMTAILAPLGLIAWGGGYHFSVWSRAENVKTNHPLPLDPTYQVFWSPNVPQYVPGHMEKVTN